MTKTTKTQATATDATVAPMANAKTFDGETEFSDSGAFRPVTANPDVPAAPHNLEYRIERGKDAGGKAVYCCEMRMAAPLGDDLPAGDSVYSDIVGSVPAAFNQALGLMGVAKGAASGEIGLRALFVVPTKGDNNPPEEALTAEDFEKADSMVNALFDALTERDDSETKTRAAELKTANAVLAIRSEFSTKKRWAALKVERLKSAPDSVRMLLENSNAVGYYVKFAKAATFTAFWDAMPETTRSPRTFEKEMGLMRQATAQAVATAIFDEKKVKIDGKLGWMYGDKLSKLPITTAVLTLVSDFVDNGVLGIKEGFDAANNAMIAAHYANITATEGDVITTATVDGRLTYLPSRGYALPASLFGSEGADELLDAICKALNGYEQAKTIAQAANDTSAVGAKALAKTLSEGNSFAAMSVEEAGRHLLHIMAGKLDDNQVNASVEQCEAILDFMSARLGAYANGTATKADLFTVADAPDTAEDAADEADADA